MSYLFTVSPDFTPDHLSGWYIFNTWLQRQTEAAIHLEMYDNFRIQREAIEEDSVDLIYANPYDATMLIRDKGFLPLAKPTGISDEAIIAISAENLAEDVAHLGDKIKVAFTDDPDVRMMGMIMLEPGDFDSSNMDLETVDTYVLVAKEIIQGKSDVGIFLAEAFDSLSMMVKKQLRVLVRSEISVIHHSLMLGPKLADRRDEFQQILLEMNSNEKGKGVLESLGFSGWEIYDEEEAEFMIDLMDTLLM